MIDESDFRVILAAITFITFAVFLWLIYSQAKVEGSNDQWISIFKSGFTTLGAAFTFVVGFYFGQKSKT